MNPVGYFEIPVRDLERAMGFYGSVFGGSFELATIDGNEMALFPLDDKAQGISGALAKGDSYHPSLDGSRLYFNTENLEATLAKVVSAGGKVVYPKTSIGELGWVAEFEDLEGNRIALHSR